MDGLLSKALINASFATQIDEPECNGIMFFFDAFGPGNHFENGKLFKNYREFKRLVESELKNVGRKKCLNKNAFYLLVKSLQCIFMYTNFHIKIFIRKTIKKKNLSLLLISNIN